MQIAYVNRSIFRCESELKIYGSIEGYVTYFRIQQIQKRHLVQHPTQYVQVPHSDMTIPIQMTWYLYKMVIQKYFRTSGSFFRSSIQIEGQRGKDVCLKHYLGVWQHSPLPILSPYKFVPMRNLRHSSFEGVHKLVFFYY